MANSNNVRKLSDDPMDPRFFRAAETPGMADFCQLLKKASPGSIVSVKNTQNHPVIYVSDELVADSLQKKLQAAGLRTHIAWPGGEVGMPLRVEIFSNAFTREAAAKLEECGYSCRQEKPGSHTSEAALRRMQSLRGVRTAVSAVSEPVEKPGTLVTQASIAPPVLATLPGTREECVEALARHALVTQLALEEHSPVRVFMPNMTAARRIHAILCGLGEQDPKKQCMMLLTHNGNRQDIAELRIPPGMARDVVRHEAFDPARLRRFEGLGCLTQARDEARACFPMLACGVEKSRVL